MSSNALTRCSFRQATPADAQRLSVFAHRAFVDTFGPDNTPANMDTAGNWSAGHAPTSTEDALINLNFQETQNNKSAILTNKSPFTAQNLSISNTIARIRCI